MLAPLQGAGDLSDAGGVRLFTNTNSPEVRRAARSMRTKMCRDPVKSGGKPLFLTLEMVQPGTSLLPLSFYPFPLFPLTFTPSFLGFVIPSAASSIRRRRKK